MRGKFITFEGSEGCGKSTQSRMLYDYLKRKRDDVVYLREPGGRILAKRYAISCLTPRTTLYSLNAKCFYIWLRVPR